MKDYLKFPKSKGGELPKVSLNKYPTKTKDLPKFSTNVKGLSNKPFKMDIMKDIMNSQDYIKHDVSHNFKNMTKQLPRSSMGLPKATGRMPKATKRMPKSSMGLPDMFGGLNLSEFSDDDTEMDEAYDGFSQGQKSFKKKTKGTNFSSRKTDIKMGRADIDLGWGKEPKSVKGFFGGF